MRTTFQALERTPATAIAYWPGDAQLAVAGGPRGLVGLFEARAGERIGPLVDAPPGTCVDPASRLEQRCFDATIQALAFPERGLPATASIGGTVRIWDLAQRRLIRPPLQLPGFVVGLDVSPDGSKLAVAFGFINPDNGVEILDLRSGKHIARLATGGQPRSVASSPDGRSLVSGHADGAAALWETDRWRRVGRPLAHGGLLLGVRFSPDGRTLATSSNDGSIALWDVDSRNQIGASLPRVPDRRDLPFRGAERWVTARFTPDGSRLFAVYDNGHAVRWELDPAAWRRHACAIAGGGLTPDEWEDAVPEQDYRETCP